MTDAISLRGCPEEQRFGCTVNEVGKRSKELKSGRGISLMDQVTAVIEPKPHTVILTVTRKTKRISRLVHSDDNT
jgi:hypothetical protein